MMIHVAMPGESIESVYKSSAWIQDPENWVVVFGSGSMLEVKIELVVVRQFWFLHNYAHGWGM
jgi:hypothetical protein